MSDGASANNPVWVIETEYKLGARALGLTDVDGNIIYELTANSINTSYTPDNTADWPTQPTTVTEALDILASIVDGSSGGEQGAHVAYQYTASNNQKKFTGAADWWFGHNSTNSLYYNQNNAKVYKNGVKLTKDTEWTATSNTEFRLVTGANSGDLIELTSNVPVGA